MLGLFLEKAAVCWNRGSAVIKWQNPQWQLWIQYFTFQSSQIERLSATLKISPKTSILSCLFYDLFSHYECSLPSLTFLLALSYCGPWFLACRNWIAFSDHLEEMYLLQGLKNSPWNRPITVRPVVGLPLETLRGPGLSLPQPWCTLAFVLQTATSSWV